MRFLLLLLCVSPLSAQDRITRLSLSKYPQSGTTVETQVGGGHPLLTVTSHLGSLSGGNPATAYDHDIDAYSSPGISAASTSIGAHDAVGNGVSGWSQWFAFAPAPAQEDGEIGLGSEVGCCTAMGVHAITVPGSTAKVITTGWSQVRDQMKVEVADGGSALVHWKAILIMDYPVTPTELPLHAKFKANKPDPNHEGNELTATYYTDGVMWGWWHVEGHLQHVGGGSVTPIDEFYPDLLGSPAITKAYDCYEVMPDQMAFEVSSKIGVQEWQEAGMRKDVPPLWNDETTFHESRLVYMGLTNL